MIKLIRLVWSDIILLAALCSLVAYLGLHNHLSASSPWSTLWPNLTTDLFAIWLTVRVIDGLLKVRERRRQVVIGFRGNLNYTYMKATDLLPAPRPWNLRALEDETRWLELRLNYQQSHLREDEQARVATALDRLRPITHTGRQLARVLREVDEADSESQRLLVDNLKTAGAAELRARASALQSLREASRRFSADPDENSTSLLTAIAGARHEIERLQPIMPIIQAVEKYVDSVEIAATLRDQLDQQVQGYATYARDIEMIFLERVRD